MIYVNRMALAAMLAVATVATGGLGTASTTGAGIVRVSPEVRRIIGSLRLIDIPPRWRKQNWIGDRGQGSCVHAALVHLWHWQGRHEWAEWWAARHGNGETAEGLAAKLETAGVQFAETRSGDEAFLDWAIRTRRGAAVVVQSGSHMVNLVGLDHRHAHILDSNAPERVEAWPRDKFLRDWKQSGGWAVTPVGPPAAPDPWEVRAGGREEASTTDAPRRRDRL
jgi:hypothetical protein